MYRPVQLLVASALLISVTPCSASEPVINVAFSPLPGIHTRVVRQDNDIVAITEGKKQTLLRNINRIPGYARDIWIDDFNFDGQQDIVLTNQANPASEDQSHSIFSWNPKLSSYHEIPFAGKLSNLELVKRRNELRSAYLLDEYWTEDTYRFSRNIPYVYSRSSLVAVDVWHTSIFDPSGRLLRSIVSDDGRIEQPPNPVITTIKAAKAPIYHQPVPSSLSDQTLTVDEVVTVLDILIKNQDLSWAMIRTELDNGGGTVQGWTPVENLAFH